MNTHTEGPWKVDGWGFVVATKAGGYKQIASPRCMEPTPKNVLEMDANAALIAAAPELVDALKELQKQIHVHHKMNVKKDFSLLVADSLASKALAKAEGRFP